MRKLLQALLFGVLALGGLTRPASAGAEGALAGQAPAATFRGGVEAVSVSITVRDSRGRVVKDLKKADFQLLDFGQGRDISDFYAGDAAISLGILLDISGSMAVGGNIDRARQAIEMVLDTLQTPRDEAAFYTFDSKLQEVVPFTTQLERIRRVSLEGHPWGTTTLYDSIGETARSAAGRANRHRALLVVTDGVDTGSRLTPPEVSGIASSIDVPVYLLTVVNPVDHPGGRFEVLGGADRASDRATLADLARWTGGEMFIVSAPAHTAAAIADLFSELRHQYLITFEPGPRPGWHPLEIRTRKKNLVVHARSGYFAGPARAGS